MERFETYQKKIVVRSGLGQSTVAGYLSGTRKPKTPELVEKLVRGLLPDEAGKSLVEQVLHDGLIAAGFAAPPLTPATSLVREQLARYNGDGLIAPEEVAEMSSKVEHFAEFTVEHRMRELQAQGER